MQHVHSFYDWIVHHFRYVNTSIFITGQVLKAVEWRTSTPHFWQISIAWITAERPIIPLLQLGQALQYWNAYHPPFEQKMKCPHWKITDYAFNVEWQSHLLGASQISPQNHIYIEIYQTCQWRCHIQSLRDGNTSKPIARPHPNLLSWENALFLDCQSTFNTLIIEEHSVLRENVKLKSIQIVIVHQLETDAMFLSA